MKIVVLGGAGNMGCIAVQALAGDDRVDEVLIADINTKQAKTVADYIKSKKIIIVAVDLNKKDEFVQEAVSVFGGQVVEVRPVLVTMVENLSEGDTDV